MITALLPLMLMQVGVNPAAGQMPGVPEELRDRPQREELRQPTAPFAKRNKLSDCLTLAGVDPAAARNRAQAWRESADSDMDLAQSAHCLGLALVQLQQFDDARRIFEVAAAEAPEANPGYRARLSAMAGNAALAGGKPATAEPLFTSALTQARMAGDADLANGLLLDRARALYALERWDEASAVLTEARTVNPQNAQNWLLSAALARRDVQLEDAQKYIEQAAQLAPRDPGIGLEAGMIAGLAGRAEDARRSFASVIEVAPDSEEAAQAKKYLEQLQQ